MERLCNVCARQYNGDLPFCPYCGALTDGEKPAGNQTEKDCLHIFSQTEEDLSLGFSPLDEPETDFLTFKNAISGQNKKNERSNENAYKDRSSEYLKKNASYSAQPDLDEVFEHHFYDGNANENGFTQQPHNTSKPASAVNRIAKTGKAVREELFDNKETSLPVSSRTEPDRHGLISELICLTLGLVSSFVVWSVIFDCDRKTALSVIPFFTLPLLISACSVRLKIVTAFDNVIVPLLFILLAAFGLHLGYDNDLIRSAWVPAAAIVFEALCIFIPAQFSKNRERAKNNGKAVILLSSCTVVGVFVAMTVADDSFLVVLASFLLSAAAIYISVFDSPGLPVLISTLLPSAAELIFLKALDKGTLTDTVRTYIFLALLFIPAVCAVEINDAGKERRFRLKAVNILGIMIFQLLELLIYFGLCAGAHKYYITLSSEILTVQNAIYAVILLVSNGLYFAIKALIGRND